MSAPSEVREVIKGIVAELEGGASPQIVWRLYPIVLSLLSRNQKGEQ